MDLGRLSDTGTAFQQVTEFVRMTDHESLQFLQICATSTNIYLYFSTILELVEVVQNRKENICSRLRRKVIFS